MISAKIKSISFFESRSKNSSAFFPLDAVCTSVAPARKSIDCTSNSVGTSSSINITDNFSFFCPPSRLTFTSLMLLLLSESSLFVCVWVLLLFSLEPEFDFCCDWWRISCCFPLPLFDKISAAGGTSFFTNDDAFDRCDERWFPFFSTAVTVFALALPSRSVGFTASVSLIAARDDRVEGMSSFLSR